MAQQICFPNHEGQPFQPDPPSVDGYVEPEPAMSWAFGTAASQVDVGWTGASRQTYGDATSVAISAPLMALQGVRHNSQPKLYLSFVVRRDVSFDDRDRIVLVFHPNFAQGSISKTGHERRIDIQPVLSGAGAAPATPAPNEVDPDPWGFTAGSAGFKTNRPAANITCYRWNTGSGAWSSMTKPSGLDVKVRSWDAGANNRNWSVEVEVPTTVASGGSNWIDLTSSIGFFADVIRVNAGTPLGLDFVTQFVWPTGAELDDDGGLLPLSEIPIEPSKLGEAILGSGAACSGIRGVKFDGAWGSIGARAPGSGVAPGSAILATENEFVARLVNDGANPAGNVTAEFRIANWGIGPGVAPKWNALNVSAPHHNPTAPQTLAGGTPASPTTAELTTRWTPPAGTYGASLHPHQCVWVLLDSNQSVSFVRTSAKRNMNVVPLSESEQEAEISGVGWAEDEKGDDDLEFLLLESHHGVWRERGPEAEEQREQEREEQRRKEREEGGEEGREEGRQEHIELFDPDQVLLRRPDSKYEQAFVTVVDGYRRTPRTLTIDKDRLPIYTYTDSFGQIGVHDTDVLDALEVHLDGPSTRPLGDGGYLVMVPKDGAAQLTMLLRTVPWEREDRPREPDPKEPREPDVRDPREPAPKEPREPDVRDPREPAPKDPREPQPKWQRWLRRVPLLKRWFGLRSD